VIIGVLNDGFGRFRHIGGLFNEQLLRTVAEDTRGYFQWMMLRMKLAYQCADAWGNTNSGRNVESGGNRKHR